MKWRARLAVVACGFSVVFLAAGCAAQYNKVEESFSQPINCATAEGDIRALQSEKASAAEQLAAGASFVTPTGIIVGALMGTAGAKYDVSSGDYNRKIDERIRQIKSTCKVE